MLLRGMNCYYYLSIALYFFSLSCSSAQTIEISEISINDRNVFIQYNLLDSIKTNSYIIRVYSSWDGFTQPIKVSGDVGIDVKTGANKRIFWNIPDDSLLNRPISFELRGRRFVPFINTNAINQYDKFKRNTSYNLNWSGGSAQNILNFDLYTSNHKKIYGFTNIGNAGHHTIKFPVHLKPGNYYFKISDAKNEDEVVNTSEFVIKRKVPLLLKAVPILAIGFGATVLLKNSNRDSSESDLPPMDRLPQ